MLGAEHLTKDVIVIYRIRDSSRIPGKGVHMYNDYDICVRGRFAGCISFFFKISHENDILCETKLFPFHRIFNNGGGGGRVEVGVQANAPLNPPLRIHETILIISSLKRFAWHPKKHI